MNERRKQGTGSIETLASGRKRARIVLPDGQRHDLGTYDTEEEADGVIAAAIEEAEAAGLQFVGGATLKGALPRFLDHVELSRSYAAMTHLRSVARCWLATAPFADWPLKRVTSFPVQRWVSGMARGEAAQRGTIAQRLSILRKFCDWAVQDRLIERSFCEGVEVPAQIAATEDAWTYLTPSEQEALMSCPKVPEVWALQIQIAIWSGIREGEQFALRLRDVHVDEDPRIVVRYGSRNRGPKGKKIRTVPLFGRALDAVKRWLELLPKHCPKNEHGLFFPGRNGGFQKVSRIPGWSDWLKAAGIERRVRWHDLRHTCGASLVSGWWGRAWRLQEVQALLGHWSITETERYAHLAHDALRAAAAATGGTIPRRSPSGDQGGGNAGDGELPRYSPRRSRNEAEVKKKSESVGSAWADASADLLRAALAGDDCTELKDAVARAALDASAQIRRLAIEALGDGPHALDRAIELARLAPEQTSAPGRLAGEAGR